jgi:hypothetical protein
VIGTHRELNDEFLVYVDCIEFNSEKLVASAISQQLNAKVQKALEKLVRLEDDSKLNEPFLMKSQLLKLNITPSRNLDCLLTSLNNFSQDIRSFKEKEIEARIKNNEKVQAQPERKKAGRQLLQYDLQVHLGPFEHFFFYLVLDNVKSLFKIERQKKILEKLAINQVHLEPRCFSMVVINDSLVQEV